MRRPRRLAPRRSRSGPEPESVAPTAPAGSVVANGSEQRRVRRAVRLVQAVVGAAANSSRRLSASAAPSSAARPALKAASACGTARAATRAPPSSRRARLRHERDRSRRRVVGDARDATVPGQADAAGERRREVVGVALEVEAELEQLVGARLGARPRARPRRGRARSSPRSSRARARAGCGR